VVFQNAPAAFDGIVLAVLGRIVRQLKRQPTLPHKRAQTSHKLGAPTVTFGSVVEVEQQGRHLRIAVTVRLPPRLQEIDQTIARDLGSHGVHTQLALVRQQDAHRRPPRLGMKSMIGRFDLNAILAAARIIADVDRGVGIHRKAEYVRSRRRRRMDLAPLGKDSVGLDNLFWGRLLRTFWGGTPSG